MSRVRSRRGLTVVLLVLVLVVVAVALASRHRSGEEPAATGDDGAASTTEAAPTGAAPEGRRPHGGAGASGTDESTVEGTTPPATPTIPVPDSAEPSRVGVTVTYSQWDPSLGAVVAAGYVGDTVEQGGTCTVELHRDGDVRTAQTQAEAGAATTSCGEVRVDGAELSPGTWTGVLRYASDRSAGVSAEFTVVVL